MSNPYQPPKTASTTPKIQSGVVPVRFAGGWPAILAIGVVAGAAVMLLFVFFDEGSGWILNPFVVVGLFWFVALLASTALLRNASIGLAARVAIPLLALPAAYFLYIPVCSFGALMMAGGNYTRVDGFPMVLSSVISFAAILLLTCRVIRRIMNRRHSRSDQATDLPEEIEQLTQ